MTGPTLVVEIRRVRTLSDAEAEETPDALIVLRRYAAHNNLFILTELNYRDLELALTEYSSNFRKYSGSALRLETLMNNCSRLMLNYLSSFRMFTDHSVVSLKRRFGKDSAAFLTYKATESGQYDSVFAYRFLYRFRNYVQHLGLPIEKVSHTSTRDGGADALKIIITKRRLLDDRNVWRGILGEIEALPNEVSVTEYFPQLRPCIEVLRAAYHVEDGGKIVPAKESLARLINEIGASIGRPCYPWLGSVPEGDLTNLKLQFIHFPLHVLGVFPDESAPE